LEKHNKGSKLINKEKLSKQAKTVAVKSTNESRAHSCPGACKAARICSDFVSFYLPFNKKATKYPSIQPL